MRRILLLLLLAAIVSARASDFIPPPAEGVSKSVTQPHVTAELISETPFVAPGKPFLVALHLHMDPGWHTYWINYGDAGLTTRITWTLPPGFNTGPIQWPVPEIHMMGPLTTYGYGGDVYLLTTLTPPANFSGAVTVGAHATWLVCREECIPGKADLALHLASAAQPAPKDAQAFFAAARARLPAPDTRWNVQGSYDASTMTLQFTDLTGASPRVGGALYFFPEQPNVLDAREDPRAIDFQHPPGGWSWPLVLQQNGEKPDHLSGILVSDQPLLETGAKSVYLPAFPVAGATAAPAPAPPPAAAMKTPAPRATASAPPAFLLPALGAAFLGGLILNLMPCVLPVLSLKVFSLIRHAGENPRGAWRQGAAFTAGVVLSFWALAGVLLILRAAGSHLGWGFQMQSPGFVLTLVFVFFLLALNLFGVFELGTSLVGLDARAAGHSNGLFGSFLNGALATLAATPCTAPFMGSALGFAAQQPPAVSLLIFTMLALGMAAPYLLLTVFPGALRLVPRPGAWMEAVKQFMGFLLLATVIFLVYVFGALVGADQVPFLLAALLVAGIAAWIYGRWSGPVNSGTARVTGLILAVILLGAAIVWSSSLIEATPPASTAQTADGWQPWTPAAVDAALDAGHPAFVDFTAAWCLSCKVNERVALETEAVRAAFARKHVALFRADWTHADPAISAALQAYHRDGVPLYLYYSPAAKDAPEILPEVLTPGLVLDALNRG
jgi:thiol:disulfide interchange protein DsbD